MVDLLNKRFCKWEERVGSMILTDEPSFQASCGGIYQGKVFRTFDYCPFCGRRLLIERGVYYERV